MMNTGRSQNSTNRSGNHATLVAAFSSCSEGDPKNSDGGVITGLVIDAKKRLLAVDNDAGVVKVFTLAGKFLYSFGKGLLVEPYDIFITSSGKIAVSDPGAGDIKVFSKSGKYLLNSERGFHLHEPYGIDYHPWSKETVIVDRMISCVFVHAPGGEVKDIITKYGHDDDVISERKGQIKSPHYVCFDSAGDIYISDQEQNSMHAYDPEYNYMFSYGHSGRSEEELNSPSGITVDRYGNILLADRGHSRVHLLDKSGNRKSSVLTWEDGIVEPQALTLTSEGQIILSEASTGLIKIFSYTHLPEVTANFKVAETLDDVISVDNDCLSLDSSMSDNDEPLASGKQSANVPPKSGIIKRKSNPNRAEVENFQRSLQMLTDNSADEFNQAHGFPAKSIWSQISSHHYSSVPSTAAPRGPFPPPRSSKQRLAELNKEFETGNECEPALLAGLSSSTPNVHGIQSPQPLLMDSSKHLSDVTRSKFAIDENDTSRKSTNRKSTDRKSSQAISTLNSTIRGTSPM